MFEGLLPSPHDEIIADLLFTFATWQGYAKLRLHTDQTIAFLRQVTQDLGEQLRRFVRETCPAFRTVELPREVVARLRRKNNGTAAEKSKIRIKIFDLDRSIKIHVLGHYVEFIIIFGTCDSFSTQRVS